MNIKNSLFALSIFLSCSKISHAQVLKVREVFDFRVGDEIGIIRYHRTGLTGLKEYKLMEVADRAEFGNDSLKITFDVSRFFYESSSSAWKMEFKRITYIYYDLDSFYFKDFKQKDSLALFYMPTDTLKERPLTTLEFRDSIFTDSCSTPANWRTDFKIIHFTSEHKTRIAYKGLGVLEHEANWDGEKPTGFTETFGFYIKNGKLCGNKKDFPLSKADKFRAGEE